MKVAILNSLEKKTEHSESLNSILNICLAAFDITSSDQEDRKIRDENRFKILNFITRKVIQNYLNFNKNNLRPTANNELYAFLNYYFGYLCTRYVVDNLLFTSQEGENRAWKFIQRTGVTDMDESLAVTIDEDGCETYKGAKKLIKDRNPLINQLFNEAYDIFKKQLQAVIVNDVNKQTNAYAVLVRHNEKNEQSFKNLIRNDWFCYFIQTGALVAWKGNTSLLHDIYGKWRDIVYLQQNICKTCDTNYESPIEKEWKSDKHAAAFNDTNFFMNYLYLNENCKKFLLNKSNYLKVDTIVDNNNEQFTSAYSKLDGKHRHLISLLRPTEYDAGHSGSAYYIENACGDVDKNLLSPYYLLILWDCISLDKLLTINQNRLKEQKKIEKQIKEVKDEVKNDPKWHEQVLGKQGEIEKQIKEVKDEVKNDPKLQKQVLEKLEEIEKQIKEVKDEVKNDPKWHEQVLEKLEEIEKQVKEVKDEVKNDPKLQEQVLEKVEKIAKQIKEVKEEVKNDSKWHKQVLEKIENGKIRTTLKKIDVYCKKTLQMSKNFQNLILYNSFFDNENNNLANVNSPSKADDLEIVTVEKIAKILFGKFAGNEDELIQLFSEIHKYNERKANEYDMRLSSVLDVANRMLLFWEYATDKKLTCKRFERIVEIFSDLLKNRRTYSKPMSCSRKFSRLFSACHKKNDGSGTDWQNDYIIDNAVALAFVEELINEKINIDELCKALNNIESQANDNNIEYDQDEVILLSICYRIVFKNANDGKLSLASTINTMSDIVANKKILSGSQQVVDMIVHLRKRIEENNLANGIDLFVNSININQPNSGIDTLTPKERSLSEKVLILDEYLKLIKNLIENNVINSDSILTVLDKMIENAQKETGGNKPSFANSSLTKQIEKIKEYYNPTKEKTDKKNKKQ